MPLDAPKGTIALPRYRICGLVVASEVELPGLLPEETGGPVDVTLRCRPVPKALAAPLARNPFWQVDSDRFLLDLPEIGRFLATGGRLLDLELAPGSALADALPFLLGTGLGVILHQRGAPVLHAATVERNGRAYAFCAPSGTGKSTLAAALCQNGCRLVADDVCAVVLDADGRPAVEPDGRRLKLFAHAIERLELQAQRGEPVRTGIEKHYVAPPAGHHGRRIPLAAIYWLHRLPSGEPDYLYRMSPLVAAQALHQNTYRRQIARAYAGDGRAMAVTAAVVRQVPVFHLARSEGLARLSETVAALSAHWRDLAE